VAQPRFLARELIALPQFIASSGPRPSGVAWVSATLPVPSPSVMCITIVRLSGHVNSLAPAPQVRAQAERHVHNQCLIITDLVVDDQ
jgi:hypothetical protein